MAIYSCGHCGGGHHRRPQCPLRDVPERTARATAQAEQDWHTALYEATMAVAKILGRFPPEERVEVATIGFTRSEEIYRKVVSAHVAPREAAARDRALARFKRLRLH